VGSSHPRCLMGKAVKASFKTEVILSVMGESAKLSKLLGNWPLSPYTKKNRNKFSLLAQG
jgi:hypothetical protein